MRKILAAMLIFAVFLVAGCTEEDTGTKYVCPDGSVVSEPSLCNVEKNETSVTTTTKAENENIIKIVNNTDALLPGGNYLSITGWVENNGICVARFVKVNAKFYKDEELVKQYFRDVDELNISPGKASSFSISARTLDYDYYMLVAYGECLEETVYSEELKINK